MTFVHWFQVFTSIKIFIRCCWVQVKGQNRREWDQIKWEWRRAGFVSISSEWPVKASKERCMANARPRCDISRQASPGALYWAAEPSDPSASAVYWQLLTAAWRICALKANGWRRSDTRETAAATWTQRQRKHPQNFISDSASVSPLYTLLLLQEPALQTGRGWKKTSLCPDQRGGGAMTEPLGAPEENQDKVESLIKSRLIRVWNHQIFSFTFFCFFFLDLFLGSVTPEHSP